MKVKTEIELKDLLQIILLIIGGVLTYSMVDCVATKNDTIRTKQLLLKEIPALYPNLQTNYTNQFSKNKDTLYVKVYLKNFGQFPVFIPSPNLYLLHKTDTIWGYKAPNLFSTFGSLNPQQERKIEYFFLGYSKNKIPDSIRMIYPVNLDNKIVEVYSEVLKENLNSINSHSINWITNKEFNYYEAVYDYGDNDIWEDFFENPR
jgi:hypothetical protein